MRGWKLKRRARIFERYHLEVFLKRHALQRLRRIGEGDSILMTPKVNLATPWQLWAAHLLCQ
jgi:hypothetical protein